MNSKAWFKDMRTGFRLVEVLGRKIDDQVHIREADGRERICNIAELFADNATAWLFLAKMDAHKEIREYLAKQDMALARQMPPYQFE